jgi:hypothetical protein
VRSKGCLSNKTALAMIFKLAEAAEKSWRRLDGHNQLPKIILGVGSPTELRSSSRKLKPLPPDPFRHQDSVIARRVLRRPLFKGSALCLRRATMRLIEILRGDCPDSHSGSLDKA